MNVDHILGTFHECGVESLLIGGMNFLLRHEPVLTYDIDFWIHDTPENLVGGMQCPRLCGPDGRGRAVSRPL